MMKNNLHFLVLCFLGITPLRGQNVPYQFEYAARNYFTLSEETPLSVEWSPWLSPTQYPMAIGFPFQVFNHQFDSVFIVAGAKLRFYDGESGDNYTFFAFSEAITDRFWVWPGANESLSPISYSISGEIGNRILKIQWANAGFQTGLPSDFIHFQIHLCELDNSIEVYFGPQQISSSTVYEGADQTGPVIGWKDESTSDRAFLLGPAANPTLGIPPFDFYGMDNTPPPHTMYRFSPITSGRKETPKEQEIRLHQLPDQRLVLNNSQGNRGRIALFNTAGKLIGLSIFNATDKFPEVGCEQLPTGIYWAVVSWQKNETVIHFKTSPIFLK